MSKIAEQKALEIYPQKIGYTDMGDVDWNLPQRNAYLLGYDQAMQDFLDKAEKWILHNTMRELLLDSESTELVEDFVDDFKNYMKDAEI